MVFTAQVMLTWMEQGCVQEGRLWWLWHQLFDKYFRTTYFFVINLLEIEFILRTYRIKYECFILIYFGLYHKYI